MFARLNCVTHERKVIPAVVSWPCLVPLLRQTASGHAGWRMSRYYHYLSTLGSFLPPPPTAMHRVGETWTVGSPQNSSCEGKGQLYWSVGWGSRERVLRGTAIAGPRKGKEEKDGDPRVGTPYV